jgi:hypothetical protein
MLIKICPCGQINKASEVLCEKCGADLTRVHEQPGSGPPKPPVFLSQDLSVETEAPVAMGQFELEAPVKVCPSGHVNPINAVICLTPDCHEDITLVPIMRYKDYLDGLKGDPGSASKGSNLSGIPNVPQDDSCRSRLVLEKGRRRTPLAPFVPIPPPVPISPPKVPIASPPFGTEEPFIIYGPSTLALITDDGERIRVKDGDIVGRQEVGADYFQKFSTVSRRHARFFYRNGGWTIKNFSDNSSFVNDERLEPGDEKELVTGDNLRLSSKCSLRVELE